jgi:hypothetical protein
MVVGVKIVNTSNRRGSRVWLSSNGQWNSNIALPGREDGDRDLARSPALPARVGADR